MWLAFACLTASALTTHQSALGVDLTVGGALSGAPPRPAGDGTLALGWFRGPFDDDLSFGRYWWLGPTARVELGASGLRAAPTLELRRGVDLLVGGVSAGVSAGAVFGPHAPGLAARVVGVGKFRRTRTLSFTGRLELGADLIAGEPSFAGALGVGLSLARPLRRR